VKHPFVLILLLSVSVTGIAATINVPVDQPTIQAAIDAAKTGDRVLVAPGTYFENINFAGKAIVLSSSGGKKVTIIDGGHAGSVVTFNSGEGQKSALHGFTLQNGSGEEGGGIYIYLTSPRITGNIVTHNTALNGGGGIAVTFSSAYVQGNLITNNSQTPGYSGGVGGGGIEVGGAGAAQIIGNLIQNNRWTSANGGGMSLFAAGTPTLKNNIIEGNVAYTDGQGGGIYIVNDSDALIVQNLIYNNVAGQGSGIYFGVPDGYRGPLLINNTIVGTSSSVQGSAVYADGYYDQVLFYNNLLIGAGDTSVLYCDSTYDQTSPTLTNNDGYSLNGTGIGGACSPQNGVNGNLSIDPLFVGKTNFRLKALSPVIDAGDNSAPDLPPLDLAGKPRIVNGKGGPSGIIDMGAYEYHPSTPPLTPE
jgi:parallel beta-helix repeat protein